MNRISELFEPGERDQYQSHIRRLKYDDRDYVMYKNMLDFLWEYVVGHKNFEDMELIYEEYSKWNMAIIDKVLYHDHDLANANIRRCYQSILELVRNRPEAALEQIRLIGKESFSYDGKPPKIRMDARGRVFRPMSKLFVLYNIAKYYKYHGRIEEMKAFMKEYPYAFTIFDDEDHKSHDQYYREQFEVLCQKIIYPIDEKVYKIPWGPKDFYLYFDDNSYILL